MAVDIIARGIAAGRVPITAYDMAVAGGYVGTKEEFEADMGNSGTNATNAANSAAAAEAAADRAVAVSDDIAQYTAESMTAPANISAGEYILAAGTLYRATANIASGSTLTPNGNVVAVTVGEELTKVIASDAQKADADGTSPNLTAGNALQLVSTVGIEDQVPYNFRTAGGTADIGDRETDMVVGGTIAWNQQINPKTINYTSENVDVASQNDGKWTATIRGSISTSANVTSMRGGAFPVDHKVLYLSGNDMVQVRYKTPNNIVTPKIVSIPSTWTATSYNVTLDYPEGTTGTFDLYPVAFDLTQMFGTTIADYIYSLEQANAGDGVAWFKKLFPKDYYAYDTGSLQSVQTSAHKMVGFNAFDKNASDVVNGKYLDNNGVPQDNSARKITGYIPVVGDQRYYFADAAASSIAAYYVWYDSEKNIISGGTIPYTGGSAASHLKTAPANAAYLRVSVINEKWDSFVVNLSWDGEKDGTYEPYVEYNYPLDSSLELRGIPKLDENNRLYYDGDTYESDGTVTRRYAFHELSDLAWSTSTVSGVVYFIAKPDASTTKTGDAVSFGWCSVYSVIQNGSEAVGNLPGDGVISFRCGYFGSGNLIAVRDDSISTVPDLRTKITSKGQIVTRLLTPTTETAEPYTNPQIVNDFGTEEYVDAGVEAGTRDVAIPVGHETFYQANLRAKLEMSPDSPDGDGDYIVRQANGENTYVPLVIPNELPAQPSEDGTYHLQVVVTGGVPTVSWVADT